jgi:serine/threonine protein kinase
MSTYTSEPGTRLAGRYRLVDQTSAGTGWTYWKATDETLARPVTVLTFASGFPRITETVTAARAASRLNDTRFAQVFDVEDSGEGAYLVLEWVAGEALIDLLAEGPLDPARAVAVIAEAAQALAAAHRAGQAHLRLDPMALHWTPGGGVKICGLGIDAALAGPALVSEEAPGVADTRDLARLLYAALTGYWPGPPGPGTAGLPPAPADSDGEPCTPRQVAAGVPAGIDSATCRALFQQPNRQGPALSTPDAFADALTAIAPPRPAPAPAPAQSAGGPYGSRPDGATASYDGYGGPTNPYPLADGESARATTAGYRRRHPTSERSAVARGVVSVVIVLVLAAIGVTAWAISRSLHHGTPAATTHQQHSNAPSATASVVLKPVSDSVFTVKGSPDDSADAQYAINPTPGKYWHTDYYLNYPQFGHLTSGMGLLVDMGKQVRLSQLTVQFGTKCCTTAIIEIGNSNAADLSSFTAVTPATSASGVTNFNISNKTSGRYVLIWITSLPPLTGNQYQAQIYDVTVRGTSA